jgi:hypothetical protein
MNHDELLEYIKNKHYQCPFCISLQEQVVTYGLRAIQDYGGMVCSSIEDMKIRLWEADTGETFIPIDPFDMLEED